MSAERLDGRERSRVFLLEAALRLATAAAHRSSATRCLATKASQIRDADQDAS